MTIEVERDCEMDDDGEVGGPMTEQEPVTQPPPHPAKFSASIIERLDEILPPSGIILDPMAGLGTLNQLASPTRHIYGVEIEHEWAAQAGSTVWGDSTTMRLTGDGEHFTVDFPKNDDGFNGVSATLPRPTVICTSPAYGSRMCLDGDSLVTTWDGPTPIRDVQVGTLVLTHRGRWRPVLWAGSKGVREVVAVSGQGPGRLICTPDHQIWSSLKRDTGMTPPRWRGAADMAQRSDVGPSSAFRFHYWATPIPDEPPPLPDIPRGAGFWRFVGFWLGNGSVGWNSADGRPSTITVSKDVRLASAAEAALGGLGAPSHRRPDRGNTAIWDLHDTELASWLRLTFGRSSYTKTLPGWTLGLTDAERGALLDGWLDADGCRRTDRSSQVGVSVSPRLIRGMQVLAASVRRSCGYASRGARDGVIGGRASWFVESHRLDVHAGISRKAHLDHGAIWYAVRSVEPLADAREVWDLEVDEDHSFVANGIAVHNSDSYAGDAKGTRRFTYRISLGRPLTEGSGAGLHWGDNYRDLHGRILRGAWAVLERGGLLAWNVSDHIRGGKVQPVVAWYLGEITSLHGARDINMHRVATPRMRHGANHGARVDHEWIITARKGDQPR